MMTSHCVTDGQSSRSTLRLLYVKTSKSIGQHEKPGKEPQFGQKGVTQRVEIYCALQTKQTAQMAQKTPRHKRHTPGQTTQPTHVFCV